MKLSLSFYKSSRIQSPDVYPSDAQPAAGCFFWFYWLPRFRVVRCQPCWREMDGRTRVIGIEWLCFGVNVTVFGKRLIQHKPQQTGAHRAPSGVIEF